MARDPIRVASWGAAARRLMCTMPAAELEASAAAETPPAVAGMVEWKPLYRRLSLLAGAPEGSVAEALDRWVMEGRKVTAPQLMRHVRELRKYRRHDQALETMNWMETNGLQMPNGSHAVRLDLISKTKGLDSAEEYFASLPEFAKHYGTYGALLSCYCKENLADKAITLYEKMKELNLALNSLLYNNLMNLYMKSGHPQKVPYLFEEMKSRNIIPDSCTYRILMKSYGAVNDMDSIEKLTQEMESSQGALDWFTYCHLAALYNASRVFEKAEAAIRKAELVMDGHDLSPFRFFISLYAGAGNLAEVKRIWQLLKDRIPRPFNTSPRPTNMNYLIMLQALKKLGDMDALKHCFKEWEADCKSYDIKLVNTVIAAYLENGMAEEAGSLQENAAKKGARSDLHTFALFIDYYLRNCDMELAWKCSQAATAMVKRGELAVMQTNDQDI